MTNQEKLLRSLLEHKLHQFEDLVKCEDIDVNHFYGHPYNGTLIDIACRSSGNGEFVQILVDKGGRTCLKNNNTGKYPIHETIVNSDPDTLRLLIRYDRISANVADHWGNTPLHLAVKLNRPQLVKILIYNKLSPIDINISTSQTPTALHLALHQRSTEIIQTLLEFSSYIDFDLQKDGDGYTCRQLIRARYPQLLASLPDRSHCNRNRILYSLLTRGEVQLFTNLADEIDDEELLNGGSFRWYLWLACYYGHVEILDLLLRRRIDPKTGSLKLDVPAVRLQIKGVGSILHQVIQGMFEHRNTQQQHNEPNDNYRKCLDVVLGGPGASGELDINFEDHLKYTALDYAVLHNDDCTVRSLIYAGAHMYRINSQNEVPLASIKPSILARYLDDCITSTYESSLVNDYVIVFDYKIFLQPSNEKDHVQTGNEIEFFTIIERIAELRIFLKHPLLQSFLHMKWHLVKKFYTLNLIFYFVFCTVLSWYIYQIYSTTSSSSNSSSTSSTITRWLARLTQLLLGVFVVRELGQFSVSQWCYFKSPENWLEITLILMTVVLLVFETCSAVAAGVILVSWMELLLLLGRHPLFSTYIEIFNTVAMNFSKFLALYSIMIVSFAFSFYILFKNGPNEAWRNPFVSLFQTVIMMTGEFNLESVPFGSNFGYIQRAFFILFVFLIAIVLYNLLHGLAVSDTQAIIDDAELVALVSRMKLISQLELLSNHNLFDFLRCLLPSRVCRSFNRAALLQFIENEYLSLYRRLYRDNITIFNKISPETRIRVAPYFTNVILLPNTFSKYSSTIGTKYTFKSRYPWKMDKSIVKQAMQIVENRNEFDNRHDTETASTKNLTRVFQSINKSHENITSRIRDLELKFNDKIRERDEKLLVEMNKRIEALIEAFKNHSNEPKEILV